jgi:hypothetical protein
MRGFHVIKFSKRSEEKRKWKTILDLCESMKVRIFVCCMLIIMANLSMEKDRKCFYKRGNVVVENRC